LTEKQWILLKSLYQHIILIWVIRRSLHLAQNYVYCLQTTRKKDKTEAMSSEATYVSLRL